MSEIKRQDSVDLEENHPLIVKRSNTYAKFCCCSLGTAATTWSVFLVAYSTFLFFDENERGATFTASAALGIATAVLIFWALGNKNAFPAFIAFYTQLAIFILWAIQLAISAVLYRAVMHNDQVMQYRIVLSHFLGFINGRINKNYTVVEIPVGIFLIVRMLFHAILLLISSFIMRMIWSFYRVLRAGGTTFEKKTADQIENEILNSQLHRIPSYRADGHSSLTQG